MLQYPTDFPVRKCSHTWLHLRVQTRFLREKFNCLCNSITYPLGLMAQEAAAISKRVLRRIYPPRLASPGWRRSELELDFSRGAPGPRRPEAGTAVRRASGAGFEAKGAAQDAASGQAEPLEATALRSGPALSSEPLTLHQPPTRQPLGRGGPPAGSHTAPTTTRPLGARF